MKCKLCDANEDGDRFELRAAGWRSVEVYGPRGNKYLCACPSHTTAQILETIKTLLAEVNGAKQK